MSVDEVLQGVHRIGLPTPYAVGPVNCYLIDGPEPALIDCGHAISEAALRQALAELRLAPTDLARVVLTHHHPDHSGGLGWLLEESGAALLGDRRNDHWLRGEPTGARRTFMRDLCRYCSVDAAAAAALERRFEEYEVPLSPRAIDVALAAGAEVQLGGEGWRVLETPGHAGTHIALLREDGTLLGGDTLLERIATNALFEPPYPGETERARSLLAYRATLQRLATLEVGLVLPGHGAPFTGAAALIERRLRGQEDRSARLLAHLAAGHQTVYALAGALVPALPARTLSLLLSEVLGHLDLLEERGLAAHEGDAPARYRAT